VRKPVQTNPDWLREAQQTGKQYSAFQANRHLHNLINISTLGAVLAAFAVTMVNSQFYIDSVLVRFAVQAIAFGYIYFVIHILVIHEASHNIFLITGNPATTKRINRLCGWLACLYFGVHYDAFWRVGHVEHHRNPVVENDPQNCPRNTRTGKRLLVEIGKLLIWPPYSLKSVLACPQALKPGWQTTAALLIFQGLLFGSFLLVAWTTHTLVVFLAAIHGFGIAQSLNLVKISMEHGGATGKDPRIFCRSRSSDFFLRSLLMPLNISMHFEHHLIDTIPWYNLRAAHLQIFRITPEEMKPVLFNCGLRATIRQIQG